MTAHEIHFTGSDLNYKSEEIVCVNYGILYNMNLQLQ